MVWRLYTGTDGIGEYVNMNGDIVGGYEGVRPAGSSFIERGLTPAEDLHLGFESWSEYADVCGQSRVWGGVHFWPSVEVVDEIASVAGTAAFKYWESLMLGEAPLRGEFKPQDPDPLLDDLSWTRRQMRAGPYLDMPVSVPSDAKGSHCCAGTVGDGTTLRMPPSCHMHTLPAKSTSCCKLGF